MNDRYFLKKSKRFYLAVILNVIEGILSGSNFLLLYILIRSIVNDKVDINFILNITLILIAFLVIRLIIYAIAYTQAQISGANISKNIRIYIADKLKEIPLSRFSKSNVGRYINVASSSVNSYEKIITHHLGDIFKNFARLLLTIVFVSILYLPAGLILLITSLSIIPTMYFSIKIVDRIGNKKNEILNTNVSNIMEYLNGIQTLRAYGMGGTKFKEVTKSMRNYSDISYLYEKAVIPLGLMFNIFVYSSLPLIVYFASQQWLSNNLDTTAYFMLIMIPLSTTKLTTSLFVDLLSFKNLSISKQKILDIADEPQEQGSDIDFIQDNYSIEFDNVSFSYTENQQVLKNISFKAEDRQLTALVGDSGSGKSTVLNLLAKFYDSDSGVIKIGGTPIMDYKAERILDKISMVDQDVFLFNDSITNNIHHANPNATDKQIIDACKLANAHDFIINLENGYDTLVGENGSELSGGERQRLSIARTLLIQSPVILLDEATASLDIENELMVKKAIVNMLEDNKSIIMIAHTLSLIKNANKIIVLDKGSIVEQGTHDELMSNKQKYYQMYIAQDALLS